MKFAANQTKFLSPLCAVRTGPSRSERERVQGLSC